MTATAADSAPASPASKPASPWSGNLQLGYLASTGNTESASGNFAFTVEHKRDRWSHGLKGSAVAADDGGSTAQTYTLGWNSNYDLSKRDYVFGRFDALKQNQSAYDQQFNETIGYGRHVIVRDDRKLDIDVGAGLRQSELESGESEQEAILRFGTQYLQKFNEHAQLNAGLTVNTGVENTYTEASVALKTRLLGKLAAVLSYTVRNNTSVPDDKEKTDTQTSVSLEYSF